MAVSIPTEIIKEIAEYLDAGMKCFYHIHTGDLKDYPDKLKGYVGFDEEIWQESMDKVENNYHEYLNFEGMESHQSFRIIQAFISDITDAKTQQRFEDAISYRNPFQNFKQLLHDYPDLQ